MQLKVLQPSELTDQICVIIGTRPGIIKMSPIIKLLHKERLPAFVIHTGQHYSYSLDKKFFNDLQLPEPEFRLKSTGDGSLHGQQTAIMLAGIEKILVNKKPKIVLVCGDANTNLAGALAARKLHIQVGHVESGLRSFNWRMPEEHNRVMIDHISEHLFAPTERAKRNLIEDNVQGKIYVTGNTIVDALIEHSEIAEQSSRIIESLDLKPQEYILVTIHREENVDVSESVRKIEMIFKLLTENIDCYFLFPIHPRTLKRFHTFGVWESLEKIPRLRIIDPVGYLDFLRLLSNAKLVLSDSGGIQEESCVLDIPCVTLRESTERQETVEVDANRVVGLEPEQVLSGVEAMLSKKRGWPNPYGDGQAARRIVDVLQGKEPEPFVLPI